METGGDRRDRSSDHPAEDRTRALKKETDAASKERLKKVELEIAELEPRSNELITLWLAEKEKLVSVQRTKEQVEQARNELDMVQRDQGGGRIEPEKRSNPIGCSMSISYRRRVAFGPAAPVPVSGLLATR